MSRGFKPYSYLDLIDDNHSDSLSLYKSKYSKRVTDKVYKLAIFYSFKLSEMTDIEMSPELVDIMYLYLFTDKELGMRKIMGERKVILPCINPYTSTKILALNTKRLSVSDTDLNEYIKDCSGSLKKLFKDNKEFLCYKNIMGAGALLTRIYNDVEVLETILEVMGIVSVREVLEQLSFGIESGILLNSDMIIAGLGNIGITKQLCKSLYPVLSQLDYNSSEIEDYVVRTYPGEEFDKYLRVCTSIPLSGELVTAMIRSGGRIDISLYSRLEMEYSSLIGKPIVFTNQNGNIVNLLIAENGIVYNGTLILDRQHAMVYRILRYTPNCIREIVGNSNMTQDSNGYIQYFDKGYVYVYTKGLMNNFC